MNTTARPVIGLNLCPFTSTRAGGSVHYALSLLRGFLEIIPDRLLVLVSPGGRKLPAGIAGLNRAPVREIAHDWELFGLESEIDVLFAPHYLPSAWLDAVPVVTHLADLQHEYHPEFFVASVLRHRRALYGEAVEKSAAIITPSRFTQRTMMDVYGVGPERVPVVYHGCHPIFSDQGNPGARPFGLPARFKEFLFYPANSWIHKNHVALFDALALLNARGKRISCVLTGHRETRSQGHVDIGAEIAKRGLGEQVVDLGRVSLPELKFLYAHAAALVHPSLFEGFGIPLVEAMAAGCPVAAADRTSIPEVLGEAGRYFDPGEPETLVAALTDLLENRTGTEERVTLGRQRARMFQDETMAAETVAVLDGVADRAARRRSRAVGIMKACDPDSPVLSVVVIPEGAPDPRAMDALAALLGVGGNAIEAVVSGGTAHPDRGRRWEVCGLRVLPEAVTDTQELADVAETMVRGRFVFLSDGRTMIRESFILDLVGSGSDGVGEAPDLVFGDCLLRDRKNRQFRLRSDFQGSDRGQGAPYNAAPAFVTRRSALIRALRSEARHPILPLHTVARLLRDHLPTERTDRTVAVRFRSRLHSGEWNYHRLRELLMQQSSSGSPVLRLAEQPWLQPILRAAAGCFAVLSREHREGLEALAKRGITFVQGAVQRLGRPVN